jgi:hypothetical protein
VPRIPDGYTRCVAYLYPTEEAAKEGQKVGGTGFLVGVEFDDAPGLANVYVVTNSHVAGTNRVVRLNTRYGTETVPVYSWHHSPTGDDVMVGDLMTNLGFDENVGMLRSSSLLTPEQMESIPIRHGDEIFMVSRFEAHDGTTSNEPVVRFGTLAKRRPVPVPNKKLGTDQESFLTEMRSLPGHSGSPTFVYFTGTAARLGADERPPEAAVYVLGIDWGHLPHHAHVLVPPPKGEMDAKPVPERWYVEENSGISCVVPAWKITEILEGDEDLVSRRAETEETFAAMNEALTHPDLGAVEDSADGDLDGGEFGRFEDLTRKLVHTPKPKRPKPSQGSESG